MHCERLVCSTPTIQQIPVARTFARKEQPRAASATRVGIAWQERLRDELQEECFCNACDRLALPSRILAGSRRQDDPRRRSRS